MSSSSTSSSAASTSAEQATPPPSSDQADFDLSKIKEGPFFFQKRFFPMWSGFVLGVFTDNMLKQALLIGLTFQVIALPGISETKNAMPFVAALFALAMVLFSPLSGQVADKYETSLMFRWTKCAEFFLMILAAIGFFLNSGVILIIALFCMGVQSAFFSPVRVSAMPKYLHANELVRGNAMSYSGLFVANLLGYAIGGGLIETPNGSLIIAGLLIVMAAGGWWAVHHAPVAKADAPDLKIDWNIFRQMHRMTGMIRQEPPVVRPIIGVSLFWFIASAITVAFPLINKETLNTDGTVTTAFMVVFAVGGLLGGAIATGMGKGSSGLQFSTIALLVGIVTNLLLFGFSQSMMGQNPGEIMGWTTFFALPESWVLIVLFIIASASMGVYMVPLQAAIQRRVNIRHRARIIAASNMYNALAAIPGALIIGLVAVLPIRAHDVFLFIALIEIVIVVYMYHRKANVPLGLYDEMLKTEQ